jgi:hypothetical protein
VLTIQPIRTGNLLYLNVHDEDTAPFYEWIQTDARLYAEGLQLIWRTAAGAQAMVTLDLEYCEEVASTSSPNNPAARDDLGTMAAQRQSNLADNLYPFKLVYDDGTERLGCDSARERGKLLKPKDGQALTCSTMGQCYLECSGKNKRQTCFSSAVTQVRTTLLTSHTQRCWWICIDSIYSPCWRTDFTRCQFSLPASSIHVRYR